MATSSVDRTAVAAVKEHLLSGKPLTRLEAIVLYGCSNLPEVVYELRKQKIPVKGDSRVPYATAMVRINEHAVLKPPENLPIREILFTEYRLER
jgi:hypothetical protein